MTTAPAPRNATSAAGLHARLTFALAGRQLGLLFLVATTYFLMWFFFDWFQVDWEFLWDLPPVGFKYFVLPAMIVFVYGYVLLTGLLFALGPSERSFNLFFFSMLAGLFLVNYDHSIIDWLAFGQVGLKFRIPVSQIVSAFKVLLAGPFFLFVILMHYNILADDFAKRMMRRGLPTEEALKVRPGMLKVLVPTVVAASALAAALALLGEVSAFVFNYHGLFVRKINLVLLAGVGIALAFTLRGILREMDRREGKSPPTEKPR